MITEDKGYMYTREGEQHKIQVTPEEFHEMRSLADRLSWQMMQDPVFYAMNWVNGVQGILGLTTNQVQGMLHGNTEIIVARNPFDKETQRFLPVAYEIGTLCQFACSEGREKEFRAFLEQRGYKPEEIEDKIRFGRQNWGF